ncbi:MAG: hypothetical protein ACRD6W_16415, partial [Nitrososphaerales archaeon]
SDQRFAPFDPEMVRRTRCIPTEYLYYFYDPAAYVASVRRAGTTRGELVRRLSEQMISAVTEAFETGDVHDAWAAYARAMGARHGSYMRLDIEGAVPAPCEGGVQAEVDDLASDAIGGYEGVALRVIDALSGAASGPIVVNVPNGSSLDFLDPGDVVEVPAMVDEGGVQPIAARGLTGFPKALVFQVKEYERAVVEAATTADAALAALALSLHPLVPGLSAAREMMDAYRGRHRHLLAYLR